MTNRKGKQKEVQEDVDEVDELLFEDMDSDSDSEEGDPNVFKIRHALDPPRAAPYSLYDLFEGIHQGVIDLSPPYQRDVVWTDKAQTMLIDSIWRNYHIPPIIFAVVEMDDGSGDMVKRVVDGKQRLTSIIRFIEGSIPHVDSKTKKKWFFTKPTKESHRKVLEVPETFKKQFKKKQINCIEYHGITEPVEREIFMRVQLGMQLSSAEKMRALISPWTLFFSDLVAKYVSSDDGIPTFVKWSTRRERDFQCVGLMVMVCYYLPGFIAATTNNLKKFIDTTEEVAPSFKIHIQNVLAVFQMLVSVKEYQAVITSAAPILAPVEVVFIGALISHLGLPASSALAGEVYKLRSSVRRNHKDIRMNDSVSKTMFNHIIQLDPKSFQSAEPDTYTPRKRRRRADGGDGDAEYRPGRDD